MERVTKTRQSQRYAWNVRLHQPDNGEATYEARLCSHGRVVMHRNYAQETAAALAADVGKIVLHGDSADRRLNFPGDRNLQRIAVDFEAAARTLKSDLLSQGRSVEEAAVEAVRSMSEVAIDVTNSLKTHAKSGRLDAASELDCLRRLDALADITQRLQKGQLTTPEATNDLEADFRHKGTNLVDADSSRSGPVSAEPVFHHCHHEVAQEESSSSLDGVSQPRTLSEQQSLVSVEGHLRSDDRARVTDGHRLLCRATTAAYETLGDASLALDESQCLASIRGTGLPLSNAMTHNAAEMLLSLSDASTNLFKIEIGCTARNLQYIFLTQDSVYRLMDLENSLVAHGCEGPLAGIHLLRGAMILLSHADGWRLRRIKFWDRVRGFLTLEDGSNVTALQISSKSLEETQHHVCYVIREINYRMEHSGFEAIALADLAAVYSRLLCCREALQSLQTGGNTEATLRLLVSNLATVPSVTFLKAFRACTDPLSTAERRRSSEKFLSTVCLFGPNLKRRFQYWLGPEQPLDGQDWEETLIDWARAHKPSRVATVPNHYFCAVAARDPRSAAKKRTRTTKASEVHGTPSAPKKSVQASLPHRHYPNGSTMCTRSRSALYQAAAASQRDETAESAFLNVLDIQRAALRVLKQLDPADLLSLTE